MKKLILTLVLTLICTSLAFAQTDNLVPKDNDAQPEIIAGVYSMPDSSELNIKEVSDGKYKIDIIIFRLCYIEGCDGAYDQDSQAILFTGTDPNDSSIKGTIKRIPYNNRVVLEFTDSTWEYLPNGEQFVFYSNK